jgi:hypothetical protein
VPVKPSVVKQSVQPQQIVESKKDLGTTESGLLKPNKDQKAPSRSASSLAGLVSSSNASGRNKSVQEEEKFS